LSIPIEYVPGTSNVYTLHSKMEEESFDGKGEAILNLGKVVDVTNSFKI
jgi:hypothetical protein